MRFAIQTTNDQPNQAGEGDIIVDVITGEPIAHLNFMHSADRMVQIRFLSGDTAIEAGSIELSAKHKGDYNGDLMVFSDGFSLNGSLETGWYEGFPSFNTADLNALFNSGNLKYIDLALEVRWLSGGHSGITRAVSCRVWNDYLKPDDTEVIPTPGQTGLTGVTGVLNGPGMGITRVLSGDSADLDQMDTEGISGRMIVIPDLDQVGYTLWYLRGGTEADSPANGIVRPHDYATTTNEKVWVGIL